MLSLLDENYTYNVSQMFWDVLGYSIRDWDGEKAFKVEVDCWRILDAFAESPSTYEAMNPKNGWGDFAGARSFIRTIWGACREAPNAIVRVG